MHAVIRPAAITAILFHGAIFGFFYAWVCSTMWGLDTAAPETAIAAMQAMNGSVRNGVFAPAFFATPLVSLLTAGLCLGTASKRAALYFALAAVTYLLGGLILTMLVNVPMNENLAAIQLPLSTSAASQIWAEYSGEWQFWNQIRTAFSAIALVLAAIGLACISPKTPQAQSAVS